ncbi:hypothetical protein [Cellulomonas timonensis]|uniref:hypothetical protein n=1 Tax=Cellulomonas timonensis TaxID=1689271 RepID=UPI00082C07B2|nr:hypothetical protein [Cellulomonas timonensis]
MIDTAIDRLTAAYASAGLPPLRPPSADVDALIAQANATIHPLRLPEQLETLWRRVDPTSLVVAPHPALTAPELALSTWVSHRDDFPGMTPQLLFPVCYESHSFLFVELDAPGQPGGACLDWAFAGSAFTVVAADLAAYLDLMAAMIELGEVREHRVLGRVHYEFDPDGRWPEYQEALLARALPLPGLGDRVVLDEDVRLWPAHWLAADGVTAHDRYPQGATTTVGTLLLEAGAGAEASGTIQARVVSLVGSGDGARITVDDGTGTLDVWCPAPVCRFGPVIRRAFELDVRVRPYPSEPPELDDAHARIVRDALEHDLGGAQEAVVETYRLAFETPAAAEATAIRPLD